MKYVDVKILYKKVSSIKHKNEIIEIRIQGKNLLSQS